MKTSFLSTLRHWLTGSRPVPHAPAALREAGVQVLSLQCEDADSASDGLASRFLVDAVIEPAAPDAAWQLDELTFLPPQAAELAERGEPAPDLCQVLAAQIMENGHFQPVVERSCIGSCRVRLRVHVRHGLRLLRFRYRDALFGQVLLPAKQLQAF